MGSSYSTNPTNTGVPVPTLRKSQNFSITNNLRVRIFCFKKPIFQLQERFHFGQCGFVLATFGAYVLCTRFLRMYLAIAVGSRYGQWVLDCAMILHKILTVQFCQTCNHRHEETAICGVNLAQFGCSISTNAFVVVWSQNFGAMQVCYYL